MIISTLFFDDAEGIPNSRLAVIIYKQYFIGEQALDPLSYEKLFSKNEWGESWRNGLYNVHHYHSTAHEVLGVYSGWVEVLLGGEKGTSLRAEAGDILIIPAGVGHKNMAQGGGFAVVGSYPDGFYPDINYGKKGERPRADKNIADVPVPDTDPVTGRSGGLLDYWS